MRLMILQHDYSAFLTYWCVEALIVWWDKLDEINPKKIEESKNMLTHALGKRVFSIDKNYYPNKDIVAQILKRMYNWAEFQLYRQFAIAHMGDDNLTDTVSCVYSLLIYSKIHSFSNVNKEMRRYARNVFVKQLVEVVISELLESNLSKGLWNNQIPVLSLSGSTENIYPFVLKSISELLKIVDPIGPMYDDYISNFTSALKWIKYNEIIRHHLGNEYDNGNQEKVGSFSGSRSPTSTSQHGNPECWSTALVFDWSTYDGYHCRDQSK